MSITLTKKATSFWADGLPPQIGTGSVGAVLHPFIETMIAEDKTDGVWYPIDANSNYRLWTDQTSAQAYADICTSAESQVGRTDLTVTIEDI
jgi:hypothetical protein